MQLKICKEHFDIQEKYGENAGAAFVSRTISSILRESGGSYGLCITPNGVGGAAFKIDKVENEI